MLNMLESSPLIGDVCIPNRLLRWNQNNFIYRCTYNIYIMYICHIYIIGILYTFYICIDILYMDKKNSGLHKMFGNVIYNDILNSVFQSVATEVRN